MGIPFGFYQGIEFFQGTASLAAVCSLFSKPSAQVGQSGKSSGFIVLSLHKIERSNQDREAGQCPEERSCPASRTFSGTRPASSPPVRSRWRSSPAERYS